MSEETAPEMLERLGTDAQLWAKEFVSMFRGEVVSNSGHRTSIDEGLLITWFANAIEAGAKRADSIENIQAKVLINNIAHGWFDDDRTVLEDFALLTEEVGEGVKAWRKWGMGRRSKITHTPGCDLADHNAYGMPGEVPPCSCGAVAKPEGVGPECADIFIRLLDMCQRRGINLREETLAKMAYNETRPYRHGDLKA